MLPSLSFVSAKMLNGTVGRLEMLPSRLPDHQVSEVLHGLLKIYRTTVR